MNEQWAIFSFGGEVVFWAIALLLEGGWYFLQARDLNWFHHVAE